MHPNPAFRREETAKNIAFARERAFGTLAINGPKAPITAHIPFVLNDKGSEVELHLVRSNPIVRAAREPVPAVITIMGPDSYISPDWYQVDDQVPTWNYVAVCLQGILQATPVDKLHPMLDKLSAHFETRLLPKPPWTSEKMSDGVMEKMMRMICPFRMQVDQIDGTWKLNQNKTEDQRLSAADQVVKTGLGQEVSLLATLMRLAK